AGDGTVDGGDGAAEADGVRVQGADDGLGAGDAVERQAGAALFIAPAQVAVTGVPEQGDAAGFVSISGWSVGCAHAGCPRGFSWGGGRDRMGLFLRCLDPTPKKLAGRRLARSGGGFFWFACRQGVRPTDILDG